MTRRKHYSQEFKLEALGRANEEGVTDVLVAEELGMNARQQRPESSISSPSPSSYILDRPSTQALAS